MQKYFLKHGLEVNDSNFLNLLASIISKKHDVSIDKINDVLEEEYVYFECGVINSDLLHIYDRFMNETSREQTGSYYTPYALAEKMARMTFYDYYKDKHIIEPDFFYKPYFIDDSESLIKSLKQLKIADIACGSGVFLIACIHVLKEYYDALDYSGTYKDIITQIYGVDIQKTPLKILSLLLMDISLLDSDELPSLNLFHVDTLLEFNNDITFDIIIGNPPYIGEKGHKELFSKYKHLKGYEGRMDLFYFFIYKGYDHLKKDGILTFITTNYFITADGAKGLRLFLEENTYFRRMINLDECKLFAEAKGMHNLIFSFGKRPIEEVSVLIVNENKVKNLDRLLLIDYTVPQTGIYSETGNIVLYENTSYYTVVNKILSKSLQTLGAVVDINQGIVSGADKVTKSVISKKMTKETIDKYNIEDEDPIYVFENKTFESKFYKPFYKNSQISKYKLNLTSKKWILYVKNNDLKEPDIEYQHLIPFKTLLSNRREVKSGARDWYALQWGRDQTIFEGEKIVVPQRANSNIFGYTDEPFYSSADVYYLTKGPLKFLLGLLNSKLYYFWLFNRGKRKGKSLELYAKPLSQIPIPLMPQEAIEELTERILTGENVSGRIDTILYEYFELTDTEIMDVELLYNRGKYVK